jgi:hypothetical protein
MEKLKKKLKRPEATRGTKLEWVRDHKAYQVADELLVTYLGHDGKIATWHGPKGTAKEPYAKLRPSPHAWRALLMKHAKTIGTGLEFLNKDNPFSSNLHCVF